MITLEEEGLNGLFTCNLLPLKLLLSHVLLLERSEQVNYEAVLDAVSKYEHKGNPEDHIRQSVVIRCSQRVKCKHE